jgi:protein SCO1/2
MVVRHRARLRWAATAALLPLVAACDKLGLGTSKALPFKSIDITGADYARDFSLPDAQGRVRTMADFKGKVTLVFFGFTQCPDVCPTTLGEIAAVKRELGPAGVDVQAVFITVDPERDTPEVIAAYVAAFDPGFVALRGTPEQTRETAKHYRVFFEKRPGKTPESYTIDHTAAAYVFDRQARVRLFARHGTGPQALKHDLELLLAER